nr:ubiquitin-like modifier hub1 [Quercus suber]
MSIPRDRSASPAAEPRAKKSKTTGFKWKDKPAHNDSHAQNADRGLERGYRDRSPRRAVHKDREKQIDNSGVDATIAESSEPSKKVDVGSKFGSVTTTRSDIASKFGPRATNSSLSAPPTRKEDDETPPKPPKGTSQSKPKKLSSAPLSDEPMIVVNINDRLGTKAAIPCLASDSVKAFRAIVAAHIGRQPHEIMIKRQGERPFKDALTLQDYGVSGGVQLDLEIDTGD